MYNLSLLHNYVEPASLRQSDTLNVMNCIMSLYIIKPWYNMNVLYVCTELLSSQGIQFLAKGFCRYKSLWKVWFLWLGWKQTNNKSRVCTPIWFFLQSSYLLEGMHNMKNLWNYAEFDLLLQTRTGMKWILLRVCTLKNYVTGTWGMPSCTFKLQLLHDKWNTCEKTSKCPS